MSRDDLTPLAQRLVDTAYDQFDEQARARGEIPQFMWKDVEKAVAATLRVLWDCGASQGDVHFERVADELEGKPVEDWHLEGERKRWLP